MKRTVFVAAALAASLLAANAALAAEKVLIGKIKNFECGDNCYLTITVAGREKTGLCEAKACRPWWQNQQMPRAHIGKSVRVTIGVGVQRDAEGGARGKMLSFKTITFVD